MAIAELMAAPTWRVIDFISDLHLQATDAATFDVWQQFMQTTSADAVFILGDLFEVWVGDDALQSGSFERQCADTIRQTAARIPVFFMHGNRDFLVGSALMGLCHTRLLDDPTVLIFAGQRWLLSHGDALCIGDVPYMRFRAQVRSPEWQQAFLAQPLQERQAIARGLRQQSEARKQSGAEHADVDLQAARQLLHDAHALRLIHGHTHKPAEHDLGDGMHRVVLSDWDADARPARAEVLRLSSDGLQRIPLNGMTA